MVHLEELELPTGPDDNRIRLERSPKRVRAFVQGLAVVDSTKVLLMLEPRHLPVYYFPKQDVRMDLLTPRSSARAPGPKGPATLWTLRVGDRVVEDALFSFEESSPECSDLSGLIAMYWAKMDTVFEEEEEVFGHARDPYHRIETLPTSRPIKVVSNGQTLAESVRAVMLLESHLPPRYYIPKLDCRLDILTPSPATSLCPYKGRATQYWSAGEGPDVAWCYPAPTLECALIANHIAFFQERVEIYVDEELVPEAQTPWSR
jgi:uncharacterized protein (DUF427 family)